MLARWLNRREARLRAALRHEVDRRRQAEAVARAYQEAARTWSRR